VSRRRRGKSKARRQQPAQDPDMPRAGADGWDVAAAEREFARNKARIDAGTMFRARQSTGWRLGGSPSNAGEIKR
jgi:hypothetical protein